MLHTFSAMNTSFSTFGLTEQRQRDAESWFAFVEKKLSRFRPDSELSRLNRTGGRPFLASPLLFYSVSQAVNYHNHTQGLFNPFLGRELEKRGYDKSFEILQSGSSLPFSSISVPVTDDSSQHEVTPNRPANGGRLYYEPERIRLNAGLRSIELPPGWSVDLGGIAKGWSAEQFADIQQRSGLERGVIDAGGDIMVWGAWDSPRRIAVDHPFEAGQDLLELNIAETMGIATSSRLKRSWINGKGEVHHHITDPRTLSSGVTDLVQVTVLHRSLTAAEAAAKCLLLLGSEEGPNWLKRHFPLAGAVMVRDNGSFFTIGDINRRY